MKRSVYLALAVVAAAAGCGGSSGGGSDASDGIVSAITRTNALNIPPSRMVYDPVNETLTIVNPTSADFSFPPFAATGMPDRFDAFRTVDTSTGRVASYAVAALSTSGEGQAVSVLGRDGVQAYVLDRFGQTVLPGPERGEVRYTGDYVGQFFVTGTANTQAGVMFGDVTLTADFAGNDISGVIDNRRTTASIRANPITLAAGSLSNGEFAGATSGGAFIGGENGTGAYSGLLVGAQGDEAIGRVEITHRFNSTNIREAGVFISTAE